MGGVVGGDDADEYNKVKCDLLLVYTGNLITSEANYVCTPIIVYLLWAQLKAIRKKDVFL